MAFVVSSSQVCLVKTNHQWPSPHQQAPVTVDTVGKQFTVLERQKINNIATMVSERSRSGESGHCWCVGEITGESDHCGE